MRSPTAGSGSPPEARGSLVVSWAPREIRRPPQRGFCVLLEIGRLRQGAHKLQPRPVVCPSLAQNSFLSPRESASISSPLPSYLPTPIPHPPPAGESSPGHIPEPLTGFQLPLPLGLTACLLASFPAHLGQYVFVFVYLFSPNPSFLCEGQEPLMAHHQCPLTISLTLSTYKYP